MSITQISNGVLTSTLFLVLLEAVLASIVVLGHLVTVNALLATVWASYLLSLSSLPFVHKRTGVLCCKSTLNSGMHSIELFLRWLSFFLELVSLVEFIVRVEYLELCLGHYCCIFELLLR